MLLTTQMSVPNREHEVLGMVVGNVVHTKNFIRDFFAGLKAIIGGEIKGYTEMLREARETATRRLEDEARKLGADAVVGVRYSTSVIMQGASEIMAYGTAVKLR